MRCRSNVKGRVAIKRSTAKKCSRIIMTMRAMERGSMSDASCPKGDSQANGRCKTLNRAPSAAKPVKRIKRKMKSGKKGFRVDLPVIDRFRLMRKKRVPARRAIPKMSAKRDSRRAGKIGRVNRNCARMMTTKGTMNPQNSMRCAFPGPGFFRIFLWSRRYFKSPAQSPERFSSRPIRQTDHRLENPTNIRMNATAMRSRSNDDINSSSPSPSKFPGKSQDIKPKPT